MYDIVCVGTTAIDMYFKGGDLRHSDTHFDLALGNKYFVDSFHESVGGGATNVAIGCSKLGLRVSLVSEIGQDPFKRVIFEKLDLSGVDRSHIQLTSDYRNFSTVLLSTSGEKTVINYRTHHSSFLSSLPPDDLFIKSKALYMGNLAYILPSYRARLLRKARRYLLVTYITLGGDDLKRDHDQIEDMINHADVLIINTHEFADLVRKKQGDISFHENVYHLYRHVPLPRILVVTDGANGSYAYDRDQMWHQPAVPVHRIVDMTGAGDGFCAGFITSYQSYKNVQFALRKGAEYAAHKLSHLGGN